MERDPSEVDRRGGMTAEGGQALPGTKVFRDDVIEAWRKGARDLKGDARRRTDYWFKTFPKGYFMYNPLSGEACVYEDPLDLADDYQGHTNPGETYMKLLLADLISPDPDAKLDEKGESWLYWGLR